MPAFRTLQSLACVLSVALFSTVLWSQATPAPVPTPVTSAPSTATAAPVDPNEFMRQAADAMSLTAPDMKPWHLRARFLPFDTFGHPGKETVMEVWWSSPNHYEAHYSSSNTSRTEYFDGSNSYFTGSDQLADFGSWLLLHPLPYEQRLDGLNFTLKEAAVGANKLQCFIEDSRASKEKADLISSYCFSPTLPVLRVGLDSFGQRTTFNSIVRIHGHYLAKEIKVSNTRQDPQYTINVDELDPQLNVDPSTLAPPADARPIERKINIAYAAMAGNKVTGKNPDYPAAAEGLRIDGEVDLQATISKEGVVTDVKAIGGPEILRAGAVKGVKTWRYHPYLIAGEPVAIEATIKVVFTLN